MPLRVIQWCVFVNAYIWALELDLTSQIIPLFLQHELTTQVVLRKHGPLWTNSGMVHFSLEGLYES